MTWQKLAKLTKLLPGEVSHQLAVGALSSGIHPRYSPVQLPREVAGLRFLTRSG